MSVVLCPIFNCVLDQFGQIEVVAQFGALGFRGKGGEIVLGEDPGNVFGLEEEVYGDMSAYVITIGHVDKFLDCR
jgi:hypothetical protein